MYSLRERGSIARVGTPARRYTSWCLPEGNTGQHTETTWLYPQPHVSIRVGAPMLKLASTCLLLPFFCAALWNFPFHLLKATCEEAFWCIISSRNALNGSIRKLASPTFWSHKMPRLPLIMRHSSPDICGRERKPLLQLCPVG